MHVSGQVYAPAALSMVKRLCQPLNRRLGTNARVNILDRGKIYAIIVNGITIASIQRTQSDILLKLCTMCGLISMKRNNCIWSGEGLNHSERVYSSQSLSTVSSRRCAGSQRSFCYNKETTCIARALANVYDAQNRVVMRLVGINNTRLLDRGGEKTYI